MPRNPSTSVVSAPGESSIPMQVSSITLPNTRVVHLASWGEHDVRAAERIQESAESMCQVLDPGDFAMDIGAQTGESSLPMAVATGPTGLVLALEPNPYSYAVLAENARLNQDETFIDARNVAANDTDGPLVGRYSFPVNADSSRQPRQHWPLFERRPGVPIEGRDIYYMLKTEFPAWLPKLKYVRLAAGASTIRILEAIRPILSERRPLVTCEIGRSLPTNSRLGLYDFLDHLGYEIGEYTSEQRVGSTLSRASIGKRRQFDLIASPRPKRSPRRVAA